MQIKKGKEELKIEKFMNEAMKMKTYTSSPSFFSICIYKKLLNYYYFAQYSSLSL